MEDGVRQGLAIAALDERLEISEFERADGDASGRRPVCEGHPREGKDGDGQALGCRVVRTDVDHASAQAGEARADRSGVLLLHQQMEGLDIERRDLPEVRVALDPVRAGHEREVDAPRVDARELRLRARLLDDLHLGAERRDLAREGARDHGAAGALDSGSEGDAPGRRRGARDGDPQGGSDRHEPQREGEPSASTPACVAAHPRARRRTPLI